MSKIRSEMLRNQQLEGALRAVEATRVGLGKCEIKQKPYKNKSARG